MSGNNCVGDPFTVTVTVESEPVGANDTEEGCSDTALTYDLQNNVNVLGNGMAADFSWVATPNGNVLGESTVTQFGSIINDVITNISGADEVVIYTVIPTESVSGNTCVGNAFTVTVTIHPEPVGSNDVDLTCSDVALSYDLQSNIDAINPVPSSFSWSAVDNTDVTGESTTAQSGTFITDVITKHNWCKSSCSLYGDSRR